MSDEATDQTATEAAPEPTAFQKHDALVEAMIAAMVDTARAHGANNGVLLLCGADALAAISASVAKPGRDMHAIAGAAARVMNAAKAFETPDQTAMSAINEVLGETIGLKVERA